MAAARVRFISPGLCRNEALGALGIGACYLAAMLPMACDREGRCEDRPGQLRALLFPNDHDGERPTVAMLTDWLGDLTRAGYIRRYTVDGVPLLHVVNFKKHQHPHPHEARSTLPPPPPAPPPGMSLNVITCNGMSGNDAECQSVPSVPSVPSEPSVKIKSVRAIAGATTPTKTGEADAQGSKINGAQPPAATHDARPTVDEVVALWHELMPDCARVRVLTTARRTAISARIRHDLPTEKHWRRYFTYIRTVPFLMGKTPPTNGHARPFRPTLAWFCKPENFAKISEDFYA